VSTIEQSPSLTIIGLDTATFTLFDPRKNGCAGMIITRDPAREGF
jgi:hypothetical protein